MNHLQGSTGECIRDSGKICAWSAEDIQAVVAEWVGKRSGKDCSCCYVPWHIGKIAPGLGKIHGKLLGMQFRNGWGRRGSGLQ